MGRFGKLKTADFGYTMPVNDPAVDRPPYYYRNIESMCITYETDYETAAEMVPVDLEFADDPPVVQVMISDFGFSTLGPYKELDICFSVLYKGKKYAYIPNLFVTQEIPLIAGREIWGYAKKLASVIEIRREREEVIGVVERPAGNRIVTAVMRPERNVEANVWNDASCDLISIKLIPSAEEYREPDVVQMIGCGYRLFPIVGTDGITELWTGKGGLIWNNPTELDKLYKAPVKRIIDCTYGWFNIYLPYGYVLKDYKKNP